MTRKQLQYYRDYYAKNREKISKQRKCWRQRHPAVASAKDRRSYVNNREKKCAYSAWYRAMHAEKAKQCNRNARLKRLYGIDVGHYNSLFVLQHQRCAICSAPRPTINDYTFKLDHCHKTGAIRGILCNKCNLLLGLAKDSPSVLSRAAKYLTLPYHSVITRKGKKQQ